MSSVKEIVTSASTMFLALSVIATGDAAAQGAGPSAKHAEAQGPAIPSSIEAEHKELHAHLAKLTNSGGKTAAAAKEVEKALRPHFEKEEQFALPPLGLLSSLASGKVPDNADAVIKMTDRLKAEMPAMLREHQDIVKVLQRLRKVAQDEHKDDAVQFVDRLTSHATQEEQILYPGAIMVGEYLKLKR